MRPSLKSERVTLTSKLHDRTFKLAVTIFGVEGRNESAQHASSMSC